MRYLAVLLAAMTGCSFAIVTDHAVERPVYCNSYKIAAPIVDAAAGIAAGTIAYVNFTDEQSDLVIPDGAPGVVFGVAAAAYVVASVLGFREVATCPARKRAHQAWERTQGFGPPGIKPGSSGGT